MQRLSWLCRRIISLSPTCNKPDIMGNILIVSEWKRRQWKCTMVAWKAARPTAANTIWKVHWAPKWVLCQCVCTLNICIMKYKNIYGKNELKSEKNKHFKVTVLSSGAVIWNMSMFCYLPAKSSSEPVYPRKHTIHCAGGDKIVHSPEMKLHSEPKNLCVGVCDEYS